MVRFGRWFDLDKMINVFKPGILAIFFVASSPVSSWPADLPGTGEPYRCGFFYQYLPDKAGSFTAVRGTFGLAKANRKQLWFSVGAIGPGRPFSNTFRREMLHYGIIKGKFTGRFFRVQMGLMLLAVHEPDWLKHVIGLPVLGLDGGDLKHLFLSVRLIDEERNALFSFSVNLFLFSDQLLFSVGQASYPAWRFWFWEFEWGVQKNLLLHLTYTVSDREGREGFLMGGSIGFGQ